VRSVRRQARASRAHERAPIRPLCAVQRVVSLFSRNWTGWQRSGPDQPPSLRAECLHRALAWSERPPPGACLNVCRSTLSPHDSRLECDFRPGLPRTTTYLQSTRHWRSIYTAEAARPTHARRGPLARQLGAHDAAPRPRGEFALAGHKNKRRVGEDACVARALTCRASLSQKACRSLQHMQQRSCQFMAALRSRLALQLCCKRPQSVAVRPRRLGPLGPAAEPGSPGHAAPRLPRIPQRSCSGAPAQALATPTQALFPLPLC